MQDYNLKNLDNLVTYMITNAEFDKGMGEYCIGIKNKNLAEDKENQFRFVLGTMLVSVTRAIINPTDKQNTPEMVEKIEMDKLMGSIGDMNAMSDSVAALDKCFENKHNRLYGLFMELDESSTLSGEAYTRFTTTKDLEVNTKVNKFLDTLEGLFDPEAEKDPLNAVVSLTMFAIHAIRKCVYSHGISNNPKHEILATILDLK